jgi:hypothetical protein
MNPTPVDDSANVEPSGQCSAWGKRRSALAIVFAVLASVMGAGAQLANAESVSISGNATQFAAVSVGSTTTSASSMILGVRDVGKIVTVAVADPASRYMTVNSTQAVVGSATPIFADVPTSAMFYADIQWMYDQGISTGYVDSNGVRTYQPTANVSRRAMAAFLYRKAGSPSFTPPVMPSFSDVSATAQFYKEIEWMKSQGITTGNANGTYAPDNPVSRQAMAAFLYRSVGSPSFTPPSTASFSDVAVGSTFFTQVEWMKAQGITTGNANGTYAPVNAVSRQAMAAFLHRTTNALSVSPSIPEISGSPIIGNTLTVAAGTWNPLPDTFTYQWMSNGTIIIGATTPSFQVTTTQAGLAISVTVTGSKAGLTSVTVTSASTGPVTGVATVDADITQATVWYGVSGLTYRVTKNINISSSGSLNVQAGAIAKFDPGLLLSVRGSLVVSGSSSSRAVFTSSNDDSVGVDLMPGVVGVPAAGDWEGVGVSAGASFSASFWDERYGRRVDDGAISTASSFGNAASFVLTDSRVDGDLGAWRDTAVPIQILRNTVSGGSISVESDPTYGTTTPAVVLENNAVTVASGGIFRVLPISVWDTQLRPSSLVGNTVAGSAVPVFGLTGTLVENWTLGTSGLPFVVFSAAGIRDGLTVASGVTMTVPSGVVVKFDPGLLLSVRGSLVVSGSSSSRAVFTSSNDDSVGVDLMPGVVGVPAAGDWEGVGVTSNGSINMNGAAISYAMAGVSATMGIGTTDVIDNSAFTSNSTAIAVIEEPTAINISITGNSFVGNGKAIDAQSAWTTITGGNFTCFYLPTMAATGNTFGTGPDNSSPVVSAADYNSITAAHLAGQGGLPVKDYPDGWTANLRQGTNDLVSWSFQPCINGQDATKSYVAVTTPLSFSGGIIIPISAAK